MKTLLIILFFSIAGCAQPVIEKHDEFIEGDIVPVPAGCVDLRERGGEC